MLALPVLVVTIALSLVLGPVPRAHAPARCPTPGDVGGLLFNLVSAAILAPIGEELFFRGFATTAWARSVGAAAPAIIRGAVFFALAHVLTLFDASFAIGRAAGAVLVPRAAAGRHRARLGVPQPAVAVRRDRAPRGVQRRSRCCSRSSRRGALAQ